MTTDVLQLDRLFENSRSAAVRLLRLATFVLIVFARPPVQAQTFTVLHNFVGQEGAVPLAGLILDRTGNHLYGAAEYGGNSFGTVFRLTRSGSNWTFSQLYSFRGGSDGAGPIATPIIGPDGAIYGTTAGGGMGRCIDDSFQGCGTIFRLTPPATACLSSSCPWTETTLYRFSGGSDGSYPTYGNLAFDQTGNLYGTASYGSNQTCTGGCGVVFKLTHSGGTWTYSVLYSFTGADDGGNPYGGPVLDSFGSLYGATSSAGFYGAGTIYDLVVSSGGYIQNTIYSFTGRDDGCCPLSGMIFDRLGTLYGTAWLGGANGSGTAYSMTPSLGNWTFNVLYSFPSSDLNGPTSTLVMDSAGNLYGTTLGSYRGPNYGTVFKLTLSNGNWIESDLHDFTGGNDGSNPLGGMLAVDASGNVYGTAQGGGTHGQGVVFKIAP